MGWGGGGGGGEWSVRRFSQSKKVIPADNFFSQKECVSGRGEGFRLPYIDHTGICRWEGYSFQAIYSGSSNHRKLV